MTETRERKTVNILGVPYDIRFYSGSNDAKLEDACGYTEMYSKEIIIDDFKPDEKTVNDSESFKRKVLRHEIVHAFLQESGLGECSDWARNEEMVDWIALQFEKMQKAMKEAGAIC